MRTPKNQGIMIGLMLAIPAQAQVDWNLAGNLVTGGGEYLGCNAASTQPLRLTTVANQRLEFRTNNALRMLLNQTLNNQVVGTVYPDLMNLSGFLGLGTFTTGQRPLAMIHLKDEANDPSGTYRPWYRTGVLVNRDTDQLWIGLKSEGGDRADAVLNWSNNLGPNPEFGPDNLRFIFTGASEAVPSNLARSLNGLEAGRFTPDSTGNEVYFGLGDYFTAGVLPRERLDVLDRTIRVRRLVPDYNNDTLSRIVMVDSIGRMHWRRLSSIITTDCDWVVQDQFPFTPPHISNTYDGSTCSWDSRHGAGIGQQMPKFKLHVVHDNDALLASEAIYGEALFNYESWQWVTGVHGRASTAQPLGPLLTMRAFGTRGEAFDARSSVGVFGYADITGAQGGQDAAETIGVMGIARANNNSDLCVGLWGAASGATDPMDDWAAWFEGSTYANGGTYQGSDASLKTNVANLTGAINLIGQLLPRTYEYSVDAFPYLHLPAGGQMGFIAQELETVLPDLVRMVNRPAQIDSTGEELEPAISFKAVNYTGLIPLLTAAVKEQQAALSAVQAQLAQLQEQLAACCANPTLPADGKASGSEQETLQGDARSLLIQPNPFNEQTTLSYTLERNGRAQLLVNSADGKQLKALYEAVQEAGQYQYTWSTGDLVPGVYYVTLLLDGEPLVKKAVKVSR